MNKYIVMEITEKIIKAGYLDLKYLVDTIEHYKLAVGEIIENVEQDLGKEHVNDINFLIYQALTMVAQKFIESHEELFEDRSDVFEVYTNYLDSHVYFEDESVQEEFDKY